MFYKYNQWDPKLIIGQIISIQCLYYAILAGSLYVLDSLFYEQLTLEQIYNYTVLNIHTKYGRITVASTLLNSVFGSICLKYIVERSKKCLDHSASVTIIHLIIVSIYSGFPKTLTWWSIHLISLILMAMFGEYLCMRKELMDIPLSRGKDLDSTPITLNPILSSTIAYNQLQRNNNTKKGNGGVNELSMYSPSSSTSGLKLAGSNSSIENDPISINFGSSDGIPLVNLSSSHKYQPIDVEIIPITTTTTTTATSTSNFELQLKRNYTD
ncbi:hypothetical protein DLAC_06201 [Tieghemostelium lacteum]|uniref:Protein SYS1 homolog n=1 Tax=Tieghemostelium lacteum TaxID=361077 RepID=A0A151ZI31_TIELA|nr:hypothetical protein DLAC_06201 [Tieghemostelium lacteum]|eukprot:KYQ93504.1 hypothetical protein DLAC_06201 [Tieghemostelium lacteum]